MRYPKIGKEWLNYSKTQRSHCSLWTVHVRYPVKVSWLPHLFSHIHTRIIDAVRSLGSFSPFPFVFSFFFQKKKKYFLSLDQEKKKGHKHFFQLRKIQMASQLKPYAQKMMDLIIKKRCSTAKFLFVDNQIVQAVLLTLSIELRNPWAQRKKAVQYSFCS